MNLSLLEAILPPRHYWHAYPFQTNIHMNNDHPYHSKNIKSFYCQILSFFTWIWIMPYSLSSLHFSGLFYVPPLDLRPIMCTHCAWLLALGVLETMFSSMRTFVSQFLPSRIRRFVGKLIFPLMTTGKQLSEITQTHSLENCYFPLQSLDLKTKLLMSIIWHIGFLQCKLWNSHQHENTINQIASQGRFTSWFLKYFRKYLYKKVW